MDPNSLTTELKGNVGQYRVTYNHVKGLRAGPFLGNDNGDLVLAY